MGWIFVEDRLPSKSGWYIVYAPKYVKHSNYGKENINGMMFSKYTIPSSRLKGGWGIDKCNDGQSFVEAWRLMPYKPKRK